METCAYCRKVIVIKAIMAMVNLKSRDIENELHLSKSIVSRHMRGEKNRPEIDIYIIEHLLGISSTFLIGSTVPIFVSFITPNLFVQGKRFNLTTLLSYFK